jgi:hypothetical protein
MRLRIEIVGHDSLEAAAMKRAQEILQDADWNKLLKDIDYISPFKLPVQDVVVTIGQDLSLDPGVK